MKKFALLVLVLSLNTGGAAFAGSFPDVAADHPNYQAIEALDELEVVNGYADGTFGPSNPVTRAQAAKMIVKAFSVKYDGSYNESFADVHKDDWFFTFVMGATEAKVINGHGDGTFKPNDDVNLAETLKMVTLASGVKLPEEVTASVFLDVEPTVWYAPHALFAKNNNLVLSKDDGKLHAEEAMTRGEFAEVLHRLLIVKKTNAPFPLHTNWSYFESKTVPFKMKYDKNEWQVIEHDDEVIFWHADKQFSQASPTRVHPNSAYVTVTVDKNTDKLSAESYFGNLEKVFAGASFTRFKFKNLSAIEVLQSQKRMVDWYIYLSDGRLLVVYTEFGSGPLGYKLQQYIKSMISTLEYKELNGAAEPDYSDLLSKIFQRILVEGKGQEALDMMPDKKIIETDALGVGTGAIDYYYSQELDYTFKYEREGDVILDKRAGKTSAF